MTRKEGGCSVTGLMGVSSWGVLVTCPVLGAQCINFDWGGNLLINLSSLLLGLTSCRCLTSSHA